MKVCKVSKISKVSSKVSSKVCAAMLWLLWFHTMNALSLQSQPLTHQQPTSPPMATSGTTNVFALRLHPHHDLKRELQAFAQQHKLQAAFVLTCVGSLQTMTLRLANQTTATVFDGKWEIVSLVGTLDASSVHLHLSAADSTGRTIGGHVMDGCEVFTTAEIVLGEANDITFSREHDPQTGYKELMIRGREPKMYEAKPHEPKPREPKTRKPTTRKSQQ
jgi:predicted DNA-binding protein with PD1-like motif